MCTPETWMRSRRLMLDRVDQTAGSQALGGQPSGSPGEEPADAHDYRSNRDIGPCVFDQSVQ